MNASELIELLRKHPKARAILGITEAHMAFPWTPDTRDSALRWITVGKCVEWCDEHGVDLVADRRGWEAATGREEEYQKLGAGPTRLHAMLAAMEASGGERR